MALLARCGAVTGVLLSTCGRIDRRAQGSSLLHPLSPSHPPSVPSECPGRSSRSTRYRGLRRGCRGNVLVGEGIDVGAGQFEARGRTAAGGVPRGHSSPGGITISPTCAHSWGQLLDLSTLVTVRRSLATRRHEASGVHMSRSPPVDKSTSPSSCRAEWGPEAPRAGVTQRLNAPGERHVAAVRSGGPRCHCRARLLMRAVSSVTWV